MKARAADCAVSWCVCLTKRGSQYCAVHATRGEAFKPGVSGEGATVECEECEGTGACPDCDGEGTHECEARNCTEQHDCPSCDGTGDCSECGVTVEKDSTTFDARYLAFAFDPGWIPPVLIDYPWEAL